MRGTVLRNIRSQQDALSFKCKDLAIRPIASRCSKPHGIKVITPNHGGVRVELK